MRNPFTNNIERSAFARYVVRVIDASDPENDIQVEENALQRDRKIFTKAMLRAFIKNTVAREAWNGAPWLVKDSYAQRYKIDTNVPENLMRQSTSAARKLASQQRKETEQAMLPVKAKPEIKKAATPKGPKAKGATGANKKLNAPGGTLISLDVADNETEWATAATPTKLIIKPVKIEEKVVKPPPPPPIKYPIDDLHVPYKEPTYFRPKLHFLEPSDINGGIVINANGFADRTVSYMLETWVFLNVFCDTFHLDSFTFDDYADALQFSSMDTDCELYNEVHCSLLKALVKEGENGGVEIPLPELPYIDEGSDVEGFEQTKPEDGDEAPPARPTFMDHDRLLTNGVRHRGGELPVEEGSDWISLLQRRDFQEGGWQWIVAGLLYRLSLDGFYSLMATSLLEHLLPPGKPATKDTVREQFLVMDVNLRALLLHLLVGLVTTTPSVRRYMEECSEDMTSLRKKKIEHQRNRKAL
jgi:hypothetical protein